MGHGVCGRLDTERQSRRINPENLNCHEIKSETKNESNSALKVLSIAVGDKYNMIIVDDFEQDKSGAQENAGKTHAEARDTKREHKDHEHRSEINKPMSSQVDFSAQNLLSAQFVRRS